MHSGSVLVLAALKPPSPLLRSLCRGILRASRDRAGRRYGNDAHSAPGHSASGQQQGGDRSKWAFPAAFTVGAIMHQVCACWKEITCSALFFEPACIALSQRAGVCNALSQHALVFSATPLYLRLVIEEPKRRLTSDTALQMQAPAGCEGEEEEDDGSAGGSPGDDWAERVGVRADLVGGIGGWEATAEPAEKPAEKPADEGGAKLTKDPNKVINIEQEMLKRRHLWLHGPVDDKIARTLVSFSVVPAGAKIDCSCLIAR